MKKKYSLVSLVLLTFFVISFLTNIIGPLIPEIIESFHLSLTLVSFLPFSFFIAYGVMSIPAGILTEKFGGRFVMLFAFVVSFVGALLFAIIPNYTMSIVSLFLIGTGMAMLQVVINPLLRTAGGNANFYFFSILGQLFFGLASFLSPLVYSFLVVNLKSGTDTYSCLKIFSAIVPADLPWVSLYWIFALVAFLMILTIFLFNFPKVELNEDEKTGTLETHIKLFKNKYVILFFLGIFCYVGSEQGVANWISQFLSVYHQYDPQTTGATVISLFWGMMTVGTFVGLFLVKIFNSRYILVVFTIGAIIALTAALFGGGHVALYAFPAIGFFAAVMYPIIISLALNSVHEHHGSFSGLLITGVAGGAIVSLVIGFIGDQTSLRVGMLFLYITFGYILSIGIWARPLISNHLISTKKKKMTEDFVIGVDMGATNLRVGIVKNNKLLLCSSAEIHKMGSAQEVIDQIIGLIEGMPHNIYTGIGIGVPSVVDIEKGIVYDVQNLPAWKEVPLKDILEKQFNLPVFVNNDANCFVLGEKYFGKADKVNTIVGLTIGSGLGSGLILNGKLFPGANCGAGEVGMFSYKDGIIEQYCSGQFFETFHQINGKKVFEMANAEDTKALEIFEEFGTHLAKAIENVIYAYDPDLIVIGGSLKDAYSFYQKAMWTALQSFPYTRSIKNIRIEVSEDEHIAVMGAAALVLDSLN